MWKSDKSGQEDSEERSDVIRLLLQEGSLCLLR